MTKALRITSLLLVMLMCIAMLASCGIGSYEKKLEKAGYDVEVADKDEIEKMNEEDDEYKVKAVLTAQKNIVNTVMVIKFASSKQAKAYAEELEKIDTSLTNTVVKGSVVITGT
ncbi:MAG: hypothetical protein II980_03075, partial [Clostridia bacterium]|nr:hypothetical protein [Clostridia bacterium]